MKELGDYLREYRVNNGVSIDEAAEDLNVSTNIIENIENGNSRAFRDMLELRENVKSYAKYLGLDPVKVIDEFNDFLFEHTSKISLSDILEAEEKQKNEKGKKTVESPYTKKNKITIDKKYIKPIAIVVGSVLFLILLFLVLKSLIIKKTPVINKELKCNLGGGVYEYSK